MDDGAPITKCGNNIHCQSQHPASSVAGRANRQCESVGNIMSQLYGYGSYGGFGYDPSHGPPDDRDPLVQAVQRGTSLAQVQGRLAQAAQGGIPHRHTLRTAAKRWIEVVEDTASGCSETYHSDKKVRPSKRQKRTTQEPSKHRQARKAKPPPFPAEHFMEQIRELVGQRYSLLVVDRAPFEEVDVEKLGESGGVDKLQALHGRLQRAFSSSLDRAQKDARQSTRDISSYFQKLSVGAN
jgi:hypothetical protein